MDRGMEEKVQRGQDGGKDRIRKIEQHEEEMNGLHVYDTANEIVDHPTLNDEHISNSDHNDGTVNDDTKSQVVSVAELSVETILKESKIKDDEVHTFLMDR